ncbi:hypothetical protein D8B25_18195 [Verminephrobacter aporrectodeae subsp. tuberculatae]|nr:hypothetical protein [Verminephrobacter aporrectodeae subsp. tuberculatae]
MPLALIVWKVIEQGSTERERFVRSVEAGGLTRNPESDRPFRWSGFFFVAANATGEDHGTHGFDRVFMSE